jgi:chaperone BCS1
MKAPCPPSPRHAGIPYRRGYLLHGPPGTGKTSLVAALAGALQLPIYVASLGSGRLSDDSFAEALAGAAKRCVLLLEDVDAAFGAARDAQHGGGLTFSGVLNALDGVAAQEGRLLFLTTNHPERLDAALVRPGRVDRRIAFALCGTEHVERFVRQFYAGAVDDAQAAVAARAVAEAVPPGTISVAALQGALMQHPDDTAAGIAACRALGSAEAPSSVQ